VRKKRILLSIVVGLCFIGAYLTALRRNIHERSDRSLELRDDVAIADRVLVSITVIRADPTTRQLTARFRLRPVGNIAQDAATPRIDLRFLVNNSQGQQVFELAKGEAMSHIEATLPLEGDINKYPFDRYETNIWLLVDTPDKSRRPKAPILPPATPPASATPPVAAAPTPSAASSASATPSATTASPAPAALPADSDAGDIPPAEIVTQNNRPVPVSIALSASTPGMKYTGEVIRSDEIAATRIHLYLKRPFNLVNVSITVMCLIMAIALSVVAMVMKAIISRRSQMDVLPLSLSVGLMFGLPALRNIQPGVPPVGVLGDYFSFLWAEVFVAAAAIITALIWVFRADKKPVSNGES
jgi:hypothetical protein